MISNELGITIMFKTCKQESDIEVEIQEPCHMKMCLQAYVDSKDPDQPTHPCSLIGAFAVPQQNHWILQNVSKLTMSLVNILLKL